MSFSKPVIGALCVLAFALFASFQWGPLVWGSRAVKNQRIEREISDDGSSGTPKADVLDEVKKEFKRTALTVKAAKAWRSILDKNPKSSLIDGPFQGWRRRFFDDGEGKQEGPIESMITTVNQQIRKMKCEDPKIVLMACAEWTSQLIKEIQAKYPWTQKQITENIAAFNLMDKDGDGFISEEDLLAVKVLSPAEIQDMISKADQDGNGVIDLAEYIALEMIEDIQAKYPWTKKQITEAATEHAATFNLMDKDGDGFISAEDLRAVMVDEDPDVIQEMIWSFDRDGNGVIDFAEYIAHEMSDMEEDMKAKREAFLSQDKDGDGFISPSDYVQAHLEMHSEVITPEVAKELLREADLDGDGKVNYDEFVAMMEREGSS